MNDIPTYNHSKPDAEPEFRPCFFHYAAKISILAPILSLIFLKSLAYGFADVKPPWGVLITVGFSFLLAFIFLVCLLLAVIALAGMSRHGKDGILGRALAGLLVSAVLLSLWGAGFVHGFQTALQKRKAANALALEVTAASDNLKKQVVQGGTPDPEATREAAQKMKSALDKASRNLTGDDALVAKAASAYMSKIQTLLTNYTVAAQAIRTPSVLNMSAIQHREALSARKELVTNFMGANEKLLAFFTKAETSFRDELVRVKLPPAAVESALKGYRRTATDRNFLAVKIRTTDHKIGTAMLGMLDTLDASWGNWKYNPVKKNVVFQDTSALAKYNEYFRNMNAAADEQAALQSELVSLPATARRNNCGA